MTHFILAATYFHFAQHAVVDVYYAAPGNGLLIDIEAGEAGAFFGCQVVGICLFDAQLFQATQHGG